MKRSFIYITVAAAALALGGCKKFLTEKPLTQGLVSEYFKTMKDASASVNGIYSSFQEEMEGDGDNQTSMYGGKYHYWGEGRSDNFDRSQYFNSIITELSLNALTAGNNATDWTGLYRTIGRANTAIKYIPGILTLDANSTETGINNLMAQAYALRAMSYFYIVRLWGDAVVWTEPYEDVSQAPQRQRTDKNIVIDTLILADLQRAYNLIQKNQTPNVFTIGEAAICAITADVYMWKHDYANAIVWIKNLFKAKGPTGKAYTGTSGANLEPTATWKNLFLAPTNSFESIWSISWDYANNGCACLPVSGQMSNNPVAIDAQIYADWRKSKSDIRVLQTMDTLGGLGHVDKLIKFYPNGTTSWGSAQQQMNVYLTMYRLADIYLLYAEALNKTNQMTQALAYLNYVHVRAGLPAYTATDPIMASQDALEDAILNERRLELFGEGKRWFDLVRTNHVKKVMDPILIRRQTIAAVDPVGFGTNMDKVLWPVDRDVLNSNVALKQNPSYN